MAPGGNNPGKGPQKAMSKADKAKKLAEISAERSTSSKAALAAREAKAKPSATPDKSAPGEDSDTSIHDDPSTPNTRTSPDPPSEDQRTQEAQKHPRFPNPPVPMGEEQIDVTDRDLGQDDYSSKKKTMSMSSNAGPNEQPNGKITDKENARLDLISKPFSNLNVDSKLPVRPGYGSLGERMNLRTNYFEMHVAKHIQFYRYYCTIEPKLEQGRRRRQLFKVMFEGELLFKDSEPGIATNYGRTIITSKLLPFGQSKKFKIFKLTYREPERPQAKDQTTPVTSTSEASQNSKAGMEGKAGSSSKNKEPNIQRKRVYAYTVTIDTVRVISASEMLRYVSSDPTDPSEFKTTTDDITQAMNIIMTDHPNKDLQTFTSGKNKFFRFLDDLESNNNYHLPGGVYGPAFVL